MDRGEGGRGRVLPSAGVDVSGGMGSWKGGKVGSFRLTNLPDIFGHWPAGNALNRQAGATGLA